MSCLEPQQWLVEPFQQLGNAAHIRQQRMHDAGCELDAQREQAALAEVGWQTLDHLVDGCHQRTTIRRAHDARSNDQRLTSRELQTVRLAALGLASKQIAADLGLSSTVVRAVSSAAMRKLGLRSCSQLPAFWYGLSVPPKHVLLDLELEVVVYESTLEVAEPLRPLTCAERSVLIGVLAGQDNLQIAAARETSARTVANQVSALFRKFAASSKAELAAKSLRCLPTSGRLNGS